MNMNTTAKALTLGGVNLLALGANASNPSVLTPVFSKVDDSNPVRSMSPEELRSREASHLEIYAGCKWGHAAFDPVQVAEETPSFEVQAIHRQMA